MAARTQPHPLFLFGAFVALKELTLAIVDGETNEFADEVTQSNSLTKH